MWRLHMEQQRGWTDPLLQKLEDLKLPPPPYAKRQWVWDDRIFGFGVMLTERGKQSFVFQCRVGGKSKRLTFRGNDPAEARKWAANLELQLQAGTLVPPAPKVASYDEKTLRRAAHDFVGQRGPDYKSGPALLACLENHAKALMDRPIESLGRGEMTRLADEVDQKQGRRGGRHAAGAMVKWLNVVGHWYEKRTDHYRWPTVESPVTKEDRRGRDRVLEDHEIAALWHAADHAGPFGKYVQFLLLTGLRRDEAAFLRREEATAEFSAIRFPADRIKTRVAFTLPLSQAAGDILRGMPNNGELFFPRWSVSRSKAALDRLVNIPHWTLHDLRRTASTLMERAGVLPHVNDKVLNHVTRGVAGVYARHNYIEEKKAAMEALASLLASIVK
jgi:Phage integrase family